MNFKLNKTDIWFLALFYMIAIPASFGDFENYENLNIVILDTLIYTIGTLVAVYFIIFYAIPKFFIAKKYFRSFVFMLVGLLIIGAAYGQAYLFIGLWNGFDYFSWFSIYYGFTNIVEDVGMISTLLLAKKLYEAQVRFLEMEKEKRESELRFLKSQIDPHFLFNNLNTVDSLIDSDPQTAKVYLNKLSTLYRYLISTKDDEVVPLEEELTFAENYSYLIEQRYGKAYQFEIRDESQNAAETLIPPGALQTLLENVVKHNKGSHESPVKSLILIKNDGVEVSNDLRLKTEKVDSHGVGLNNLKSRYKLLTDKELTFKTGAKYTVKLPSIHEVS